MKRMNSPSRKSAAAASAAALLATVAALPAAAAEAATDWQFRLVGYAYVPDISAKARFPAGGGADIDISAGDLVENTHVAGMLAFEAQRDRFGGFADLVYMDVGDSIRDAPAIGAGTLPLPPGITADATLDIEATVFTAGLGYRAVARDAVTLDVFAGARNLDATATLDWAFSAPFGPFVGPAQAGRARVDGSSWDVIAGLKGRVKLGADGAWFAPFYADAGTGDSDLTWQAVAGLGYRFSAVELIGSWRYLHYEFADGRRLEDLDLNGAALGVSYRW